MFSSRVSSSEDKEFLLEFSPTVAGGVTSYPTVWRIYNKFTHPNRSGYFYAVTYWNEDEFDVTRYEVHLLSESEARQKDASGIDAWETKFGSDWTTTFASTRNPWDATKKRHFEQTPSRAAQAGRRPKITSGSRPQFNKPPQFFIGGMALTSRPSSLAGLATASMKPLAASTVLDDEVLTSNAELDEDLDMDATIPNSVSDMSGEDPSEDQGESRSQSPTTPIALPLDTISKNADILQKAYEESLCYLAVAALDLEGMPCDNWVKSRKEQSMDEFVAFIVDIAIMLAAIPNVILKHLVLGDIPKEGKKNQELQHKLNDLLLHRSEDGIPCIYIQYLTDTKGESPTAATLTSILDDVELYIRGFGNPNDNDSYKLAMNVDSMHRRDQGKRRYITKPEHINVTRNWVAATRVRIQHYPANKPLERPLSEVGWAKNLQERLTQHANHQSSNYLMNLTESICKAKYKDYAIRQYGIFRIFETQHAMLGEILCSRIAQAYTSHGGGFSHHPAGISTPGAYKLVDDTYRKFRIETYDDPEWQQNMEQETAKIDSLTQMLRERRRMELDGVVAIQNIIEAIESAVKRDEETSAELHRTTQEVSSISKDLDELMSLARRDITEEEG